MTIKCMNLVTYGLLAFKGIEKLLFSSIYSPCAIVEGVNMQVKFRICMVR